MRGIRTIRLILLIGVMLNIGLLEVSGGKRGRYRYSSSESYEYSDSPESFESASSSSSDEYAEGRGFMDVVKKVGAKACDKAKKVDYKALATKVKDTDYKALANKAKNTDFKELAVKKAKEVDYKALAVKAKTLITKRWLPRHTRRGKQPTKKPILGESEMLISPVSHIRFC